MEIRLRIYSGEILQAAKDETYLSGRVALLPDGSNSEYVYNMQAGDEEVHQSKLLRSIRHALDSLKGIFGKYVNDDGSSTGDNITDTFSGSSDYFDIVLDVSERFNTSYTDALAGLSSQYITNYVIGSWWSATNPALSKPYYDEASINQMHINRCFVKRAPSRPVYKYPKSISCAVGTGDFVLGEEVALPYTVTGDAGVVCVDDVLVESSNPLYVKVGGTRGHYTGELLVSIPSGESVSVTLYSRHDPDIKYDIVWQ